MIPYKVTIEINGLWDDREELFGELEQIIQRTNAMRELKIIIESKIPIPDEYKLKKDKKTQYE